MQTKRFLLYVVQNYSFAILRPIQAAIIARGDQVAWFLHGKEVNSAYLKAEEQQLLTVDDVLQFNPHAVFVPGNMVPPFFPGLKVAVFHGFNSGKLNRKGKEDHFNIRGCFDLYCTQGPNTTNRFKQLANAKGHFSVVETGWSALDPIFKDRQQKSVDKPTVLMCSTFSRNLTCAPTLLEKITELSQTGKWRWLIQFHPKMPTKVVEQYKAIQNEHLTFVETDDVIPLLQEADVMVCDTSSVLIMFVLQGKPVVTFNNISPKDYMVDIGDENILEGSIERALLCPDEIMQPLRHFFDETHPYDDGNSSERVLNAVDDMLNGNNLPKKRKPLNLLRRYKIRKELKYWKFW